MFLILTVWNELHTCHTLTLIRVNTLLHLKLRSVLWNACFTLYSFVLSQTKYDQCEAIMVISLFAAPKRWSYLIRWERFKDDQGLVSASDVTPTKRWLNIWCISHTKLKKPQEFQSHRIGSIIQDFREICASRSLSFRLETKMPWRQTPSR